MVCRETALSVSLVLCLAALQSCALIADRVVRSDVHVICGTRSMLYGQESFLQEREARVFFDNFADMVALPLLTTCPGDPNFYKHICVPMLDEPHVFLTDEQVAVATERMAAEKVKIAAGACAPFEGALLHVQEFVAPGAVQAGANGTPQQASAAPEHATGPSVASLATGSSRTAPDKHAPACERAGTRTASAAGTNVCKRNESNDAGDRDHHASKSASSAAVPAAKDKRTATELRGNRSTASVLQGHRSAACAHAASSDSGTRLSDCSEREHAPASRPAAAAQASHGDALQHGVGSTSAEGNAPQAPGIMPCLAGTDSDAAGVAERSLSNLNVGSLTSRSQDASCDAQSNVASSAADDDAEEYVPWYLW